MFMSAFLNAVGQVFNFAIGCVSDVGGLFTAVNSEGALENPLLLAFCALPLCGIGIGFFKRLINVN